MNAHGSEGGMQRSGKMVGRTAERAALQAALDRAIEDRVPQAVSVIGGAGIGKSRLLEEFVQQVRQEHPEARVYRAACRADGPAFAVIQRVLRARFGVVEGADAEASARSFREAVSEALGDRRVTEFLHFLGAYLDLRFPDSPFIQAVEEDPQHFALISRAVLRRFFEVEAAERPLVLVFDDLHHAQDDTLELLRYLVEALHDVPILLVFGARPELFARTQTWAEGWSNHRRIELSPLGADDTGSLVLHLLDDADEIPTELVDAVVDVAAGSPYLVEQVLRSFFAAGVLARDPQGRVRVHAERLEEAQLPLTVEDAISARISALAAGERELLEKASAMGGVFWLGALVALSRDGRSTPELWGGHGGTSPEHEQMLQSLAERDYVLPLPDSSVPGEREYAFKHNLERETLNRLASRTRMRRFHLTIAEWLEMRLVQGLEEHVELLATHYEEGGALHRAAECYLQAGDRARDRYANAKAVEHYARGLDLLGDANVRLRLQGLHSYGDVLQLVGRNEDALAAFEQMRDIAYHRDLKDKGGAAHNRIGRLLRAIGQLDQAMRHLGTGLALFEAAGDLRGIASSLDDIGKVHWMRGSYAPAERFLRRALAMRQDFDDLRSIALSQNNLGLVFHDSGRFSEALEALEESLALRQEIGDRPGMAQTLNNLGSIHQDSGDHGRAVELYEEALKIAHEVGDRMRQAVILTNLGESHYRLERPKRAIEMLEQAEKVALTLGDRILEGEILRGLGKAHMLIHDHPRAREYVGRSIALFEGARAKPFLGNALRTHGEIAAAAGWGGEEHRQARESFERAARLFEELGNEIELARTFDAYAAFLGSSRDTAGDPEREREAFEMRARASAIRERLQLAEEHGLPPLEAAPTSPGMRNPFVDGG